MDQGLIPRRYAKALYEVCLERKEDAAIYGAMQTLCESFRSEPKLAATLANPFVAAADKESLISHAAGNPGIGTFTDFLHLLAQNKRLDLMWDIARAFVDRYRELNRIFKVDITSAAPLSDSVRERIDRLVEQHVGKGTYEYAYNVDPSLIGGFEVKVGSQKLDSSVRTQLDNLKRSLLSR